MVRASCSCPKFGQKSEVEMELPLEPGVWMYVEEVVYVLRPATSVAVFDIPRCAEFKIESDRERAGETTRTRNKD